jgi:hypothetical protein
MGRVNAFVSAGNDAGREVSVGGRGGSANRVWAHLNTDNAGGSDCGLRVTAEVCGPGTESRERRLKSIGDGRRSRFVVTLPEPSDYCAVHLQCHGDNIRELARIGAALATIKGAGDIANGEPAQGVKTIREARKLLAELDKTETHIPNVILPGGATLKHALACVKIVQGLLEGKGAN